MVFTTKQTIQTMIDCNAGMVFYYRYSRPELKRIAHPVFIKGNNVICMMQDGFTKSFKIDGIEFPSINSWNEKIDEDSDDIDDEMTESDDSDDEFQSNGEFIIKQFNEIGKMIESVDVNIRQEIAQYTLNNIDLNDIPYSVNDYKC